MSVESLKSLFDVAAVVLLFLTFAAGAGVLITGNIISGRQEEKLRKFDADLTAAKTALAVQQERAANADARANGADARIAEAQRGVAEANERALNAQQSLASADLHAKEADAKAEGFRLDIARANETAERERLARLQLEARLAPRVLLPEQQQAIAANLRPLGSFAAQIFWYSDVTEVTRISDNIGSTLQAAGWTTAGAHAQGGVTISGIVVAMGRNASANVRSAADRLVSELVRNGVAATLTPTPLEEIPGPGMFFGSSVPNPQIRIMIGTK